MPQEAALADDSSMAGGRRFRQVAALAEAVTPCQIRSLPNFARNAARNRSATFTKPDSVG